MKMRWMKRFRKNVSRLGVIVDVTGNQKACLKRISNEMTVNLNVLYAFMKDGINAIYWVA